MDSPRISVVVTALRDSTALRACLERVSEQCRSLDAECLLALNVDVESVDPESIEGLEDLADRVLFEARPGKSNALNTAVHTSSAEIVAFTDDDALPDDGWLQTLCGPLLSPGAPPELAGCGGPVLPVFPPPGPPDWYRAILARRSSCFLGPTHFMGNAEQDYSSPQLRGPLPFGANCAFRRAILLDHPYDPSLGPNYVTGGRGGEDMALGFSLLDAGYRLRYVPGARVYHPVDPERMSFEYVREGFRIQGREMIRMLRTLGLSLPRRRVLERVLRRKRRSILLRPFMNRQRRLRRQLQCEFMRSMVDVLDTL